MPLQGPPSKFDPQTLPQAVPQIEAADDRSHFQAPLRSHSKGSGQLPDPMIGLLKSQLNNDEGELSIPVEHTTVAHKLLMWPSIKRLLDPKRYEEDYVMQLEEERGPVSVYGQGKTSYPANSSQLHFPWSSLNASTGTDRSYWHTNRDGPVKDRNGSIPEDANAEITHSGLLRLHPDTAHRYHRSFLERIHKLHPFLNQNDLDPKIETFIRLYCVDQSTLYRDNPPGPMDSRLSADLHWFQRTSEEAIISSRRSVGRNIDNAIILLVFALGAICETKSPLPGPVMDDRANYRGQHIPSPFLPPPPGILAKDTRGANSLHSTTTPDPALPASAAQDDHENFGNLQVNPGLSLYGFATTILGPLQGGVELKHVQASLLAGLYAGQLAHPFQSHSWIYQAARSCQVLVRVRRYEKLQEGVTLDLYNFAYWTCLQLESDLLTELDIPASGISRSEGRIGLPTGRYTIALHADLRAPGTMMMLFYSAQIHLRRILNRVHTDLYKVEEHGTTRWSSRVQEALSMNLEIWRSNLPGIMQWNDQDPPSSEINEARMRAKYYGARFIIHRPLLYHALHSGQTGAQLGSVYQNSTVNDDSKTPHNDAPSFVNNWTPPTVRLEDLTPELRDAC